MLFNVCCSLLFQSFYLPGSVDVFDKHIEDWNVNAPVLYLWSNPTWTSKHKAIAEQHGHLSGGRNKCKLQENPDFDESFVIKSDNPVNTENPEQKDMVIASSQEDLALEGNEDDKDNTSKKNKTNGYSNNLGGKRKRKKRSNSMSLEDKEDKSARKRLASRHVSPRVTDRISLETSSPKRLENSPQAHSGRHRQLDQVNFSTYHQPYAAAAYNCVETVDDVVRRYSLNGEGPPHPGMTAGRQAYSPSPSPSPGPDYGFRDPAGRVGANNSFPYRSSSSYVGEMIEENNSWGQRIVSNAGHGFPSSFGQVNPAAANPGYGETNTSAMQRYAARLDAPTHGQMNNMVNGPPLHEATGGIYHLRGPRPASHVSSLGFAPGPCRPYSQHNSSGWLNE